MVGLELLGSVSYFYLLNTSELFFDLSFQSTFCCCYFLMAAGVPNGDDTSLLDLGLGPVDACLGCCADVCLAPHQERAKAAARVGPVFR